MRRSAAFLFALCGIHAGAAIAQYGKQEQSPGMVEYQKAQQFQSVARNAVLRTQLALQKSNAAAAKSELQKAIEMHKQAEQQAETALALEKDRVRALQAAADEQKEKAKGAKDEAESKKAAAAAEQAKQAAAKVEGMEKTHKAQAEAGQEMAKLETTLAKKDESLKMLDGLLKKVADIDQQMVATLQ